MKNKEEKEYFYNECSKILNIEHSFNTPVKHRNRWNTRNLGNGRFPGFGLIRCFGSIILITNQYGTHKFDSYDNVYDYLKDFCQPK